MKKFYVVTGYDKKQNKLATHIYYDINQIAELINQVELMGNESKDGTGPIKSARDLDFDVQTRASHYGAEIIETSKYIWSIYGAK